MLELLTLGECVAEHARSSAGVGKFPSVPWGVDFLDHELGPARVGSLYVIGARTNVGKSYLSLLLLTSSSCPCLYFSTEDPPHEIGRRAASSPREALDRVTVCYPPAPTLSVLLEALEAFSEASGPGPKLAVIDLVQEIQYTGNGHVFGRADELKWMIGEIKLACVELQVIPILVSHTRRPAAREDLESAPTIFDLAEASSLEKKATCILMLHATGPGEMVITVAKNKSGRVGAQARFRRTATGWLREVANTPGDILDAD